MGADPVTIGLFVAAAGVQMYGNHMANSAQAKAERANAAAYAEQKRMSEMASRREADIQMSEGISFVGEQVSAFTKAGINIDGSALMQIARTEMQIQQEQSAILLGSQFKSRMFDAQAKQSLDTAATLRSSQYNMIQNAGIALNAGSQIASASKTNKLTSDSEVTLLGNNSQDIQDRGYVITRGNLQYGKRGK
jgi:hypothetical protein